MSCVSTTATYLRTIHENKIPNVFLALPFMLGVLLAYRKLFRPTDKNNLGMFTGATTGFLSGFLSSIVNHESAVPTEIPHIGNVERFLYSLEVLHIPVIVGSLVYSLCLVIEKFPAVNSLFLAAATATCVAMTATVGVTMMDGEESSRSTLAYASIFAFSLVESFLLILLPVIRPSQRLWVWTSCALLLSLLWQGGFFDTLVWDLAFPRFPIPGFLSGLIVIFMLDLVTMRSDLIYRGPRANSDGPLSDSEELTRDPMEVLLNAFTWHVITFVVQRLSLAVILLGNVPRNEQTGSDVWLCCLLMICFLALITPSYKAAASTKVNIILAGMVFYTTVSVTSGILTNGYFIDTMFGLTILYAVQHHQSMSPHGVLYC